MSPDATRLLAFFARVRRRVATLSAVRGIAIGLVLSAALVGAGTIVPMTLMRALAATASLTVFGAFVRLVQTWQQRHRIAHHIERVVDGCENLVITAEELLGDREKANTPMAALVVAQAERITARIDVAKAFGVGTELTGVALASVLWLTVYAFARNDASRSATTAQRVVDAASISRVDAIITPPSYAGKTTQTVRDPSRIDALIGSRLHIVVRGHAASMTVETVSGSRPMVNAGDDLYSADVIADADGFVAIQPMNSDGTSGARKLIGLSVAPDHAPRVRVSAPGRDLFLPNAKQALNLAVDADDDLGLATLTLRYTKVSGSGERFTFTEGTVPLTLARADDRTWKASAKWVIESLGLSPGDMMVYRAVATDKRPGAPPSESDSYIAEILAPGGDAAAGFALDPDQERYALSQQMVILKTQRLTAKKATMSAEALTEESMQIGVEQRRVRAEFVFMMGGELAEEITTDVGIGDLNEEAEAEGEADIAAGRMANQGRIALVRAIRAMSRAATQLNTADLANALVSEKAALVQLERAFARTRILLRALTERERLDLARRMTGTLTDAGRTVEPIPDIEQNPRLIAVRQVLLKLAQISSSSVTDAAQANAAASDVSEMAERVLRVDASQKSLQDVASDLQQAATFLQRRDRVGAQRLLNRAATALTAFARDDVGQGPRPSRALQFNRLKGALIDAARARGAP